MRRKIVEIDQEKCNGCGLCIDACHEGALQLVDGKAKLVSDEYCDGLGDCLPECPTGAIRIIEREAKPFDEELVKQKMQEAAKKAAANSPLPCGCPGSLATLIHKDTTPENSAGQAQASPAQSETQERPSELRQWPVQLNLINTQASYLKNADLLIAADCTAYACASFHEKFMKGKITLIGCPKLDDNQYYTDKIAEILKLNNPNSVTVVRMQVPCCGGIVKAVKDAMLKSQVIVPYKEVTINNQGQIVKE
ncbi:MAG: 4Fe-4S dicluster domain-containing protein [Peptococcaceae bacterium]|nr:4Fe-4S dicluster domain-containing protein [Peptococcaceae bacterium]